GITTDVAPDGLQGVALFESCDYDLIFMDCRMPVMDGYTATEKIRSNVKRVGAHIPIVALSAEGFSVDQTRCFDVGMNDFLQKPIDTNELLNVLKKYLTCSTSSVDFSVLEQLEPYSTVDQDLVQTLIDQYQTDYPGLLKVLTTAEKEKNLILFNETAHALKSVSAALGLMHVANICQWLEDVDTFSDQVRFKLRSLDHEIYAALTHVTGRKSRKV
ncbi:MAG: response regulator, partial [Bdellovibrionaceae bacterium]|nr:response regulator [Pseudobdellovibrionaceae bacterium]